MAGARNGRWLVGLAAVMVTACGSPGTRSAGPAAFATCAGCHSTAPGGKRGLGPNLYGVVGRSAGQAPGFSYSPALRDSGILWSAATLDRFLADPTAMVPGTRMRARTRSAEDRRAIIAYVERP